MKYYRQNFSAENFQVFHSESSIH